MDKELIESLKQVIQAKNELIEFLKSENLRLKQSHIPWSIPVTNPCSPLPGQTWITSGVATIPLIQTQSTSGYCETRT